MYVNKNLVNIFGIYLVCLGMSWYVFGVLDMGEVSATYRTAT